MLTDSPETFDNPQNDPENDPENNPDNDPNDDSCPELRAELDFVFGRINYERTNAVSYPRHFKLESMRRLLAELDDPQTKYSIIHVAGTKGKGSISRMIAGALNEAGILTGIYSSPHIESLRERFSVGGQLITETELADMLGQVRLAVVRLDERAEHEGFRKNSFFEIMTATAMLHFANRGVEKVVLEVGLGGRLDSTNVCEPELCVITNVSLDHTKQLGDTTDLIAREKAGIIKRGVPVVSGVRDPIARREVRETASVNNSDLVEFGEDFHVRIDASANQSHPSIRFDTHGNFPERHSYQWSGLTVNSAGQHQAMNAAIAIAALNMLPDRFRISGQAIQSSLEKFTLIGRGEVICNQPLIVMDMAHNVASVEALIGMLDRLHPNRQSGTRKLVYATSRDKDVPGMLNRLLPFFDQVVFTKFIENPRAMDPAEILAIAKSVQSESVQVTEQAETAKSAALSIQPNPREAWQAVVSPESTAGTESDLICVAGSAFLVAETRPLATARYRQQRQKKALSHDSKPG